MQIEKFNKVGGTNGILVKTPTSIREKFAYAILQIKIKSLFDKKKYSYNQYLMKEKLTSASLEENAKKLLDGDRTSGIVINSKISIHSITCKVEPSFASDKIIEIPDTTSEASILWALENARHRDR